MSSLETAGQLAHFHNLPCPLPAQGKIVHCEALPDGGAAEMNGLCQEKGRLFVAGTHPVCLCGRMAAASAVPSGSRHRAGCPACWRTAALGGVRRLPPFPCLQVA